eukprot:TRINITY_DN4567_c0_g1_i1.p1 TRINITY_DN4567_c0_g1~~TRINITY_DN4567_c0_g1_i1.p1  ORF type:complete len:193 (-),score=48.68 TRINITY_DN4567_c0_g1_i1:67-645(-)
MDGCEVLIKDHRKVEGLFEQYKSTIEPAVKRQLGNEMIRILSIHTYIEERYLYPLCREVITKDNEGAKLADHGIHEHREMKLTLDKMLNGDAQTTDYDEQVMHLIKKTIHHHGDEEEDIFPKLRENATQERLIKFGQDLEEAKKTAPTHPHPNAPDQPPFNFVAAPILHAIDAYLDKGKDFPKETSTPTQSK